MKIYQQLAFPALKQLDPERAHEYTLTALSWAERFAPWSLRQIAGRIPVEPAALFGLTFPNVVGMAAGFDKDIRVANGLGALGFGHVEVGTLTPRPQKGNPRPRIFRLPEDGAVINRMGFPNGGVQTAVSRLKKLASQNRNYVLGVSLGKQKETPLDRAVEDYKAVMNAVHTYADYLAVNISSPNTPGLRDLQGGDYLGHMLGELQKENGRLSQNAAGKKKRKPLLVKIAPDLTWDELDAILQALTDHEVDGIIAANTTVGRNGLTGKHKNETGGMSGRPLRKRSTEVVAYIHKQTNGRLPIIGVGGIATAADVKEKLDAGASLVQLYTGLIYEGPGMIGRILRELDGF